jgi:hypothetical protein
MRICVSCGHILDWEKQRYPEEIRIRVYRFDFCGKEEWRADTDTDCHAIGKSRFEAMLRLAAFLDENEDKNSCASA